MTKIRIPNPVILQTIIPNDYWYGHVYGYTRQQMEDYANSKVRQMLELLENFEEGVLTEMERRFSLRGEEHQYERLPIDDTQLGVEFAIEQFRALMPKEEE